MGIQRLTVLNLDEAERLRADPGTAVISVTDPGVVPLLAEGFNGVLRLAFHDVDDDMLAMLQRSPNPPGPEVEPFTEDQARRLVTWADELAAGRLPLHVAVHCHAGISRSSAIAWFLHRRYGADLQWQPYFAPNRRVVRLLAEAGGMSLAVPGE